jgi:hypothetical protein
MSVTTFQAITRVQRVALSGETRHEFSRYVHAGRRRTVTASKCLCTWQSAKICDRTQLYEINFRPQATRLIFWKETDTLYRAFDREKTEGPDVWPPDRIGAFVPADEEGKGYANIDVPPQLMDLLWEAALAADGVIRKITLYVKPQKAKAGYWWVFSVTLHENIWDDVELLVDAPKESPPRPNPAVVELRSVQAELKGVQAELKGVHERLDRFASLVGWPAVLIIAFAVVIGLLITDLLRH